MTRFGVMKHLRILEGAGLVATRKVGREKLHYLNPVPIRLIHDRWIGKYAEPWVGALADLKVQLEGTSHGRDRATSSRSTSAPRPSSCGKRSPIRDFTQRYFHRSRVDSSWQTGDAVAYWIGDELVVDGHGARRRSAAHGWSRPGRFAAPRLRDDPPSRVTWEIEPLGDSLQADAGARRLPERDAHVQAVGSGWPLVLSSLKSLLETGEGAHGDRATDPTR